MTMTFYITVTVDELFEIIHTAHLAVGHGGRNRMMTVFKNKIL